MAEPTKRTVEVALSSYHTDAEPGRTHHTASFPLDPSRNLNIDQLSEAAMALRAIVPLHATIQVQYGSAVMAFWSVPDEESGHVR